MNILIAFLASIGAMLVFVATIWLAVQLGRNVSSFVERKMQERRDRDWMKWLTWRLKRLSKERDEVTVKEQQPLGAEELEPFEKKNGCFVILGQALKARARPVLSCRKFDYFSLEARKVAFECCNSDEPLTQAFAESVLSGWPSSVVAHILRSIDIRTIVRASEDVEIPLDVEMCGAHL